MVFFMVFFYPYPDVVLSTVPSSVIKITGGILTKDLCIIEQFLTNSTNSIFNLFKTTVQCSKNMYNTAFLLTLSGLYLVHVFLKNILSRFTL